MANLYKSRYRYDDNELTLGRHIRADIDKAPDYASGQLESLEAKLNKATEILEHIVDTMSPDRRIRLANKLGYEEVDK